MIATLLGSTVFQTVISGVVIFLIGETIQRFVLVPLQEYKGVIGKIDNELKYYANVITNPIPPSENSFWPERYQKCSDDLRRNSCDLEASRKQLVFRTKNDDRNVADAARRLIRLSNGLGPGNNALRNDDDLNEIRKLLKIPQLV